MHNIESVHTFVVHFLDWIGTQCSEITVHKLKIAPILKEHLYIFPSYLVLKLLCIDLCLLSIYSKLESTVAPYLNLALA